MNYKHQSKDVLRVIAQPVWDPYYYVSNNLRKTYEKLIPLLTEKDKKYKILDYGCGVKPYKYIFEDRIDSLIGVDVGNNPHADILINPGEKLSFNDNEFDIVLSSQVLEHVEDVERYMQETKRVLKPNGILLLSTHGTWQYHASPYDYYRWTSMGLKTLMKKHSFETTKFEPILGQLALTTQLRLSFFNSFANMLGTAGTVLIAPYSLICQFKMWVEDKLTPIRVKQRDSAYYVIAAKNIK